MSSQQQKPVVKHDMVLVEVHETGAEFWRCPICGRAFLIQWPPNYAKIVTARGDEYAFHSCNKNGAKLSEPQIISNDLSDALDDFFSELEG